MVQQVQYSDCVWQEGEHYVVCITQESDARYEDDPPPETGIFNAREYQRSPLLPCLETALALEQGYDVALNVAHQVVVEALEIIDPEARPAEAHREQPNLAAQ